MGKAQKSEQTVETELYKWGLITLPFGLFGAYVLVNWILPILPEGECVFLKFLGIYCPGCGGTRAVAALMQGRFLLSCWYHPIVMYVVLLYAGFILTHTLEKLGMPYVRGLKFHMWMPYGMIVVLVVNFVAKNILKIFWGIEMGAITPANVLCISAVKGSLKYVGIVSGFING